MRAFGLVIAVLLALVATAAIAAWSFGWETSVGWDDTRGPQLIWAGTIAALMSAGVLAAMRQHFSKTLFSLLAWGGAFLLLILAYSYRAEFKVLWARIRGEVFTSEVTTTAGGAVQVRRNADGHFYADVEVNGGLVTFMIDTGASQVALSWDDALAAGIDPAGLRFDNRVSTASGPAMVAQVVLDRLALGPIERRNVPAVILPEGVKGSLLGLGFLDSLKSYEIAGDTLTLRP